ncbi:hypothetical protein Fot_38092 [Forsythia ovata]|uniref:Uncharacterized protein n=1 Tax=Forsythia ovata TaxID=205694 RepID=A0ABD1S0U8_9LAMI
MENLLACCIWEKKVTEGMDEASRKKKKAPEVEKGLLKDARKSRKTQKGRCTRRSIRNGLLMPRILHHHPGDWNKEKKVTEGMDEASRKKKKAPEVEKGLLKDARKSRKTQKGRCTRRSIRNGLLMPRILHHHPGDWSM